MPPLRAVLTDVVAIERRNMNLCFFTARAETSAISSSLDGVTIPCTNANHDLTEGEVETARHWLQGLKP
jgi:hypothetical protein